MRRNAKAAFSVSDIVLVLAAALALTYPFIKDTAIVRRWLRNGNSAAPPVTVWINKRSGFYYCSDSSVYGKLTPGEFLSQPTALQEGYTPAGQTCN